MAGELPVAAISGGFVLHTEDERRVEQDLFGTMVGERRSPVGRITAGAPDLSRPLVGVSI
jgi:hypothetical protein